MVTENIGDVRLTRDVSPDACEVEHGQRSHLKSDCQQNYYGETDDLLAKVRTYDSPTLFDNGSIRLHDA